MDELDDDSKSGSGTIYGMYGLVVMWTLIVVGMFQLFIGSTILYWVYRLSPKYGVILSHNFNLESQYRGLCLSWIFNLAAGVSLINSGLVFIIESCVIKLIRKHKALIPKTVGRILLASMIFLLVFAAFKLLCDFCVISLLIRNE
jgi:hypothetical protein